QRKLVLEDDPVVAQLRVVDQPAEIGKRVLPRRVLARSGLVAHFGLVLDGQLLRYAVLHRVLHELLGGPGVEPHQFKYGLVLPRCEMADRSLQDYFAAESPGVTCLRDELVRLGRRDRPRRVWSNRTWLCVLHLTARTLRRGCSGPPLAARGPGRPCGEGSLKAALQQERSGPDSPALSPSGGAWPTSGRWRSRPHRSMRQGPRSRCRHRGGRQARA